MSRRTDIALVNSGQWVRAARHRYWHISGAEVSYDHNAWRWLASTHPGWVFPSLIAAATAVEEVSV